MPRNFKSLGHSQRFTLTTLFLIISFTFLSQIVRSKRRPWIRAQKPASISLSFYRNHALSTCSFRSQRQADHGHTGRFCFFWLYLSAHYLLWIPSSSYWTRQVLTIAQENHNPVTAVLYYVCLLAYRAERRPSSLRDHDLYQRLVVAPDIKSVLGRGSWVRLLRFLYCPDAQEVCWCTLVKKATV